MCILFTILLIPLNVKSATSCNCGSLASGTTTEYHVGDGEDCCSGGVATVAFEDSWSQQSNGVYVNKGTTTTKVAVYIHILAPRTLVMQALLSINAAIN